MWRKLIFGAVAAVAVLVVTEVVLRAIYPAEALLFEWERPNGLMSRTPTGGLSGRPDVQEEHDDGPYRWRARTNAVGLREDRDLPAAKEPGTYRILALGDSWMYGWSVDQGHTLPDALEALLSARRGEPVEVINAALFGACAFDMLVRYRQFVDAYEVDGILLGQPHNASTMQGRAAERRAWYGRLQDGPATTARTYLMVRRWLAPFRAGKYAQPPGGGELETEIADIRVLVQDARARGLPVWFAELPANLDQDSRGFAGSPQWRAALAPEGVRFGAHAFGERACWGFQDRAHPSAAGAHAIAAAMTEVIVSGTSLAAPATTPRCADGPEVGPGKAGWAAGG